MNIMKEKYSLKLWVVKFCIKLVYPKFNYYAFLVFLAIKYRYYYNKGLFYRRNMELFEIKTAHKDIIRALAKDLSENNVTVLLEKCIVIPKKYFVELTVNNLFYQDNGVLWVVLKLASKTKRKVEEKENNDFKDSKLFKYNLNFVTEEIHKRLWNTVNVKSFENERIVPVTGSSLVESNTCVTTENEHQNIASLFGLTMHDCVEVTFHPLPSFEYSPKIATLAEASLIVNDYDLSNEFLKEVLSNHFEVPKLVSTNDIICINLDPKVSAKYHYKYLDLVESVGKLFFKCRKLTSNSNAIEKPEKIIEAFYIVKGVTQLSLGENTHEIKPKDEYFNLPDRHNNLSIIRLCPTGLREKFQQMQETISPFLSGEINAISSSMSSPIIPMLLLTGSLGSGRHLLVKTLAKYNGLNCLQADCNALQSSTAKQTESKISSTIQKAKAASPAIVILDNFEVFAVDPENNEDYRVLEYFINSITDLYENYTKHPIIFIAITERADLKPNIMRIFLEKFHIQKLNVKQRYEMLQWFASVMQLKIGDEIIKHRNLSLDKETCPLSEYSLEVLHRVASKTETFAYGDLDTLVHFAMRESYLKQHNSYFQLPRDPKLQDVGEEDFDAALESIRSLQSQHLDAPKIPKVHWDDIGGLDKLKKELLKTIEFPIKFPHLFKNSTLKRSGILLYGPPGCGKTLVAKAVSTELNVSFLSVKGPELLNMYIGQSEENVRKVFESARACSPCIVFLDELDALAPRRGAAGDSGGASDRVVSQLLAEVDGVTSEEDADTSSFVFIMGATNRPDLLEQSLLRPGRLDKLIYVGPYNGRAEKTCVLKALCRSSKLRPEVNLEAVAEALPERVTGADLLAVVSAARSAAVRQLVAKLHSGELKESELNQDSVILGVSELLQGVESFRPSVTDEELTYYESLQGVM